MKLRVLIMLLFLSAQARVDFIIFSFDRPMQLHALLESTNRCIKGLNNIFVIYRTSTDDFERGYEIVKSIFPGVRYMPQASDPAKDFKRITVEAFQASEAAYIMFGVDDIIVKEEVDLNNAVALMERHKAYGFYLRLGLNLNYCYACRAAQPLPSMRSIDDICIWQFNPASYDWHYAHTVDMTIYRKKDIAQDMHFLYELRRY